MTAPRITAAALVLIAAALLWSVISTELRYRGLGLGVGGYFAYAPLTEGGVEVSEVVVGMDHNFAGDPGESEIITLGVGVWEFLVPGEDVSIGLDSVDGSWGTTWTGFDQVVTVVDADWATVVDAESAGPVLPYGPMRLTVEADEPWSVHVRRVPCPSDVDGQSG